MLSRRRRLERLEKSPLFQPPPDPFEAVTARALEAISIEHLDLLEVVASNWQEGLCWTLSQREWEALEAYTAVWEQKCPADWREEANRRGYFG